MRSIFNRNRIEEGDSSYEPDFTDYNDNDSTKSDNKGWEEYKEWEDDSRVSPAVTMKDLGIKQDDDDEADREEEEYEDLTEHEEELEKLCKEMFPLIYWLQMRNDIDPEKTAQIKKITDKYNGVFPGDEVGEAFSYLWPMDYDYYMQRHPGLLDEEVEENEMDCSDFNDQGLVQ